MRCSISLIIQLGAVVSSRIIQRIRVACNNGSPPDTEVLLNIFRSMLRPFTLPE